MHSPIQICKAKNICDGSILNMLNKSKLTACTLQTNLLINTQLTSHQHFQFIIYHLNQYNKRVKKGQINDQYQILSFNKSYQMLREILFMENISDQSLSLNKLYLWFQQQIRLIKQREYQGQIRYINIKVQPRQIKNQPNLSKLDLNKDYQTPSQLMQRNIMPYRQGHRTVHKQLDEPIKQLTNYKRKRISIAAFDQIRQSIHIPRVLYPKPKIQEQTLNQQDEHYKKQSQNPESKTEFKTQDTTILNLSQLQQQSINEPPNLGLGQEPQQAQQDEQMQVTDKLRPKNKLYYSAIINAKQTQKVYPGQYMHYRAKNSVAQRSLQKRYFNLQQSILCDHRQDKANILLSDKRASRKSKIVKDIQKKLQQIVHTEQFKQINEKNKPVPVQKLPYQDQLKFGFSMNLRTKPIIEQIDLTKSIKFPKIAQKSFDEKDIRQNRMKQLKSKFSKILNLSQIQSGQMHPSLCQYSSEKRRGFSEILRQNSKSKQKLLQLDQIVKIKQKFNKNKIGVDIKTLSQGLCIPDCESQINPNQQDIFPKKDLPHNPFFVVVKQKKVKK